MIASVVFSACLPQMRKLRMERKELLIALLPLLFSCGGEVERQAAETRDFVEGVVPLSLADVSAKIRDGALGEKLVDRATVRLPGRSLVTPHLEYRSFSLGNFVPTDENTWPPPSRNSKDDPAMDRYRRLSAEARKHDIFLNGAMEWYSEYTASGKPLPFHCDFIIHLRDDGPTRTKVEVLEYNPRVRFGTRFVIGHGAPAFVADSKLVPPTTKDRVEMLQRVQSLAR